MYCRKCGKFIDYDAEYCKECEELENYFENKETVAPSWQETKKEENSYTPPTSGSPFGYSGANSYSNPSYSQPYTQPSYTQSTYTQPVGDRKEGFGKALASTILSTISFFLIMVAFALISVVLEEADYYYYYEPDVSGIIVLTIMSLGLAIPAFIMGLKSIGCFKRASREGRVKPVATLILGIVGTATTAVDWMYILLTFAMCALI